MDNEQLQALRTDLVGLMKRHGIRNASFCGTSAEGGYWGLMSVTETQDASGHITMLKMITENHGEGGK